MEKKESLLSVRHARVLYYQYKDTAMFSLAVSFLILLVNFLVFFWVVRPQYTLWQENNQQIEETKQKIATLQANNQLLASQDPSKLSTDLQVALSALPNDQDFAGIMTAISSSATNAGISLENYKFGLGELNSKKGALIPATVTVETRGDGESLKKFLQEIHQKVPVASLSTIDGSNNSTTVVVSFFSKPLSEQLITEEKVTSPLRTLTPQETTILQNLYTWQQTLQADFSDFSGASESSNVSLF